MPRTYRVDWENSVHHVMARGIEKGDIFKYDTDRADFVDRLQRCVKETDASIMAWALMPNHVHLLVRTGTVPLWKFMHKLLTGHAVYFNTKYDRVGHLFQNRYRSILVQTETYFMKLVRYIHLNPLKANIVQNMELLNMYPWTGHMGVIFPGLRSWQDTEYVLKEYNGNKSAKIKQYMDFMKEPDESASEVHFDFGNIIMGSDGIKTVEKNNSCCSGAHTQFRVLGTLDFARKMYDRISQSDNGNLRDRASEHSDIRSVLEYASDTWGISVRLLTSGARQRRVTRAREFVCFTLNRTLGVKLTDCARILNITPAGVYKSAERFSERNVDQAHTFT